MSYENILIETQAKVGIVRLNRPKALNALNDALMTTGKRFAVFANRLSLRWLAMRWAAAVS